MHLKGIWIWRGSLDLEVAHLQLLPTVAQNVMESQILFIVGDAGRDILDFNLWCYPSFQMSTTVLAPRMLFAIFREIKNVWNLDTEFVNT